MLWELLCVHVCPLDQLLQCLMGLWMFLDVWHDFSCAFFLRSFLRSLIKLKPDIQEDPPVPRSASTDQDSSHLSPRVSHPLRLCLHSKYEKIVCKCKTIGFSGGLEVLHVQRSFSSPHSRFYTIAVFVGGVLDLQSKNQVWGPLCPMLLHSSLPRCQSPLRIWQESFEAERL